MIVERYVENELRENTYICYDEYTRIGFIIDPNIGKQAIEDLIYEKKIDIKYILLTHGHVDHIMSVEFLKLITNAPIVTHEKELSILRNPDYNFSNSQGDAGICLQPDLLVKDGDIISLGDLYISCIYSPGHTIGGLCYYVGDEGIVFTGDTLFYCTIGRTDLPTGDYTCLVQTIKDKLLVLPGDTVCYPGHGKETTINYEKKYNKYLQ